MWGCVVWCADGGGVKNNAVDSRNKMCKKIIVDVQKLTALV